ncbi:histidinol-phosphate phosphatase family protein [Desulfosarcina variabilis str. Montpellier]|uniref:D-glycero-beta-D-manno-heptose 1,7-bisphosphate 7-phosphatase n=1 Tax=Desulfosarcina variabilis TaxID=2300 RepID=UPI003AFB7B41
MLLPDTIFIDRDGVINQDSPHYIKSREEFFPLPGSIEAITRLSQAGIRVIVITNQSAVNRGMMSLAELQAIHQNLRAAVSDQGGRITDIFFCPHRPDEHCACRKPKPGLILAACQRHGIDLSHAVMIGDSAKDILAGQAAGCGRTVLVQTGNGQSALQALDQAGQVPDHVAVDLAAAADWILDQRHG